MAYLLYSSGPTFLPQITHRKIKEITYVFQRSVKYGYKWKDT